MEKFINSLEQIVTAMINNKRTTGAQLEQQAHSIIITMLNYTYSMDEYGTYFEPHIVTNKFDKTHLISIIRDNNIKILESNIKKLVSDPRFNNQVEFKNRIHNVWGTLV